MEEKLEEQKVITETPMQIDTEVKDDLVRILGYLASMCLFLLVLYGTIYTCYPQAAQNFTGLPDDIPYSRQLNDILSFAVGSISNLFTYILLVIMGIISFTGAQIVERSISPVESSKEKEPVKVLESSKKEEEPQPGQENIKQTHSPAVKETPPLAPEEEIKSQPLNKTKAGKDKTQLPEEDDKSKILPKDIGPEWSGIPQAVSDEDPAEKLTRQEIETLKENPEKTALLLSLKESDQVEFSDEIAEEAEQMPEETPEKHLVMSHSRKIQTTCNTSTTEHKCKVDTGVETAGIINKREKIREIRRRD